MEVMRGRALRVGGVGRQGCAEGPEALGADRGDAVLVLEGALHRRKGSPVMVRRWRRNRAGRTIAFTSRRSGGTEIYSMSAEGSEPLRLTHSGSNDTPAWSPDGHTIAFTSRRDDNDEIYVMNAGGKDERRLTRRPSEDFSPSWSPDGRRIALTSFRKGGFGIDVMDADGTHQRRLLHDRMGGTLLPSWSPDGRHIAFHRVTNSGLEICIVNADGSGVRQLTRNVWLDAAPGWQPVVALRK